ncbi:MAG: dicarboxylate/amino acid:cation symporter [Methylococcaceae bacterium]|nr:dicarboxylate/amino acid:cation symporter [Methylococcaceae bacterium]MCI0733823.1 dicarboxylate/amino acid:cation symporter [Methylococcaceae bacterium]
MPHDKPPINETASEPVTQPAVPPGARPAIGEPASSGSWFARWHGIPLYLRILAGVVLGVAVGLALGHRAEPLIVPSRLILRMLTALAAPLVLVAVLHALMNARLPQGSAWRLVRLLLINTSVAILIGIAVANVIQPGRWTSLPVPAATQTERDPGAVIDQILDNIPDSLVTPFVENRITSVIIIAVAFGLALRKLRAAGDAKLGAAGDLIEVAFLTLIKVLHWIIELIPLAVFGVVASIIGREGFGALLGLGMFLIAVLVALSLQLVYYLLRIRFCSWVKPLEALRGMRDALVMAFSTASSTITMPVTYACLREKVGVRERSASLGALIGANFNNDGTALYQAMAALFIAQAIPGHDLSMTQQVIVVLTAIVASMGATGIPEAGIVTLTLIFQAVGLPIEYIPILLTVDWFLDRCRTTANVMGDVNVSCLLDGCEREPPHPPTLEDRELSDIA